MNAASWLENLPVQERWRSLLLKEGPRVATWALSLAGRRRLRRRGTRRPRPARSIWRR